MKNNYNSYIKSSKWKSIRNLKANLQNHICEMCGKQVFRDFEVHHNTYKNFGHEKINRPNFFCANNVIAKFIKIPCSNILGKANRIKP